MSDDLNEPGSQSAVDQFARILVDSLKALRSESQQSATVSTSISIPLFDPKDDDAGALKWCLEMEKLGEIFKWTDFELLSRASSGLVGEQNNQ